MDQGGKAETNCLTAETTCLTALDGWLSLNSDLQVKLSTKSMQGETQYLHQTASLPFDVNRKSV